MRRGRIWVLVVLILIVGFLTFLLAFRGGQPLGAAGAVHALRSFGYENIRITGYDLFSCDEGDLFKFVFTATKPGVGDVRGAICGGGLASWEDKLR